jgi:hypothetical protein
MQFHVEPRSGYIRAMVEGRDTADEMREFLLAVHATSKEHDCARIVISIRRSRAVFKPDDYGLRDESAAVRWVAGPSARERRYRFSRIVIAGAPDDVGIYALWEDDELVYYGRGAIRARLLQHLERRERATHYSWELCTDPAEREAALLNEHERAFGRPPRYNSA